jgi:acetyl-CoA acetyltransferase family protein
MKDVVIVDAVRTPIGRYAGALSAVRPDDMAALVIKEVIARSGIDPALVEEVYLGCANQAGEDNRNVARMATLLAGLPASVASVTLNRLCASGLNAVNMAARAIKCGEGEVYIAGGVESMTRAPYSLPKNSRAWGPPGNITGWDTTLGWRYPNPKMKAMFPLEAMGETAENIYDLSCAGELNGGEITREEQDAFALESQRRACEAINNGRFQAEIIPVPIPQRKGEPVWSIPTSIPVSAAPTTATCWTPAWIFWPGCAPPSARAGPLPPVIPVASTMAPAPCWSCRPAKRPN